MSDKPAGSDTSIDSVRRRYLELAGVAGVAGLAGCAGNSGTEQDGTTTDSGGTTTGGTKSGGKRYAGLTINFWDVLNVQSPDAKKAITSAVKQFQKETGAEMKVNYSGYEQLLGSKWVNAFDRGDYPHIYTSETEWSGRFVAGGWVKPWDLVVKEHEKVIPQRTIDAVKWIYPAQRYNGRGYEGNHIWELPIGCLPRTPFVGRVDHFEKAGLNPKKDFPPKSFEDAVRVGKQLQKQGPAQYGFHIYGVKWDWFDIAHPWAIAKGGKDGAFLSNDWSDVNYDKDLWIKSMQQYQNVYQKYNLSGPKTPTAGDEAMVPMLLSGQTSMAMPEWLNHPTFLRRAPQLLKSGKLQYGATWKGDSGMRGPIGLWTMGITQKPPNRQASQWKKEQRAAVDFMVNYLLAEDFQAKLQGTLGLLPIREDVRQRAKKLSKWESSHHMVQTGLDMIPDTKDIGWEYHPNMPDIMFTRIAPKVVRMLQGKMAPKKVCTQAAAEIRNQNVMDYPKNPLKS